jgi:hypothetical protein
LISFSVTFLRCLFVNCTFLPCSPFSLFPPFSSQKCSACQSRRERPRDSDIIQRRILHYSKHCRKNEHIIRKAGAEHKKEDCSAAGALIVTLVLCLNIDGRQSSTVARRWRNRHFRSTVIFLNVFLKRLFFSNAHNDYALTTALQCMKTLKNLTPRRDSNPGSSVLEAEAMTTMPRHQLNCY